MTLANINPHRDVFVIEGWPVGLINAVNFSEFTGKSRGSGAIRFLSGMVTSEASTWLTALPCKNRNQGQSRFFIHDVNRYNSIN